MIRHASIASYEVIDVAANGDITLVAPRNVHNASTAVWPPHLLLAAMSTQLPHMITYTGPDTELEVKAPASGKKRKGKKEKRSSKKRRYSKHSKSSKRRRVESDDEDDISSGSSSSSSSSSDDSASSPGSPKGKGKKHRRTAHDDGDDSNPELLTFTDGAGIEVKKARGKTTKAMLDSQALRSFAGMPQLGFLLRH
ncbi:hypothetical protein B484DRAFT_465891, partial [Ochromonadaceae sp. CCMP2298]